MSIWKLYRMIRQYRYLVPDLVEIIELIQVSGADRKLTKAERGRVISAFSRFITKAHPSKGPQ